MFTLNLLSLALRAAWHSDATMREFWQMLALAVLIATAYADRSPAYRMLVGQMRAIFRRALRRRASAPRLTLANVHVHA